MENQTAKEFALEQIRPYYKDPSTCGYEGGSCRYDTKDGRQCVLGKNLLNAKEINTSPYLRDKSADYILRENAGILRPEAVGKLTIDQWQALQTIHDGIAIKGKFKISRGITELGLFTFEELTAP